MSDGINKETLYDAIRVPKGPFRVNYVRISIDGAKLCSVGHNRKDINENLEYLIDNLSEIIARYGDPNTKWHTVFITFFRYGAKKTQGNRKVVALKELLVRNPDSVALFQSFIFGYDRVRTFEPYEPRDDENVLLATRSFKQRDMRNFPYSKDMIDYIKEWEETP